METFWGIITCVSLLSLLIAIVGGPIFLIFKGEEEEEEKRAREFLLAASASQEEEERIRALKLADVDNMNGVAFEEYVGKLLEHQGFSARVTPSTNDKGVDIIATKGDLKYAIQVKRYRSAISRRAVSDAVTGKHYYDCNTSMVITNNYFTKGAIELSEAAECRLVDRDELTEWIIDFQSSKETEASADVKNGKNSTQLNDDLIDAAKNGKSDTQLNEDLVVAVLMTDTDIQEVKELISKGANVNAKNENGLIPLISAAWLGRKDICELLISNGADVNIREDNGMTPLLFAVHTTVLDDVSVSGSKLDIGLIHLLLDNGADVNAKNKNGTTALMLASDGNHKDIVKLLRQYGAKEK